MNQDKIFRCLRILDLLYDEYPGKKIKDISQTIGISQRSVYRYVELFENCGFELIKTTRGRVFLTKGTFNKQFINYIKQPNQWRPKKKKCT